MKRASVTLKKKTFALKTKHVALKMACCGEEDKEYCYCCFCRGAKNISVTKKSEEIRVKIRIRI